MSVSRLFVGQKHNTHPPPLLQYDSLTVCKQTDISMATVHPQAVSEKCSFSVSARLI